LDCLGIVFDACISCEVGFISIGFSDIFFVPFFDFLGSLGSFSVLFLRYFLDNPTDINMFVGYNINSPFIEGHSGISYQDRNSKKPTNLVGNKFI
jgi:hypothetical protein